MGITQWFKDTANSMVEGVKSVYHTAANVVYATGSVFSAVGSVLASPTFRLGMRDWLTQSWDGFSRALSPRNYLALLGSPKTARVWLTANAGFLLRALPFVTYRYAARPLASAAVKLTISDNPFIETAVLLPLDAAAWTLLVKNYATNFADASTQNLNIATAAAADTQLDDNVQTDNPLMKPCGHGAQASAAASVNSIVHYYGSWLALRMLATSIPYGEAVTLPLQMILIGQGIMDYSLAAAENCEEDRRKVINSNNAFALGMGAAYKGSKAFWQYLLENYAGVSGFFVDDILAAILTLHFVMSMNLSRQTPLPGTKPGIDWFKKARRVTDVVVADTASDINNMFSGPAEGDFYQEGTATVRAFLNKKAIRIICMLFVDESFQDWKKLAERPAMKLFFELHGETILGAIDYIRSERKRKDYQNIDSANQWATKKEENESYFKSVAKSTVKKLINAVASEDDQKILGILMMKEFEKPLNDWYDYISFHTRNAMVKKHCEVEIIENYGADGVAIPNVKRDPGFYRVREMGDVAVSELPPADAEVLVTKKLIELARQDQVQREGDGVRRPPPPNILPVTPIPAKTGFFANVIVKKESERRSSALTANTDQTVKDLSQLLQNQIKK